MEIVKVQMGKREREFEYVYNEFDFGEPYNPLQREPDVNFDKGHIKMRVITVINSEFNKLNKTEKDKKTDPDGDSQVKKVGPAFIVVQLLQAPAHFRFPVLYSGQAYQPGGPDNILWTVIIAQIYKDKHWKLPEGGI